MTLDEYQQLALRTANPLPTVEDELARGALGVAGEAGEVADLCKKALFHGRETSKSEWTKEIGDVLWYLAVLANGLGINLDTVAQMNIAKLKARWPEGFKSGEDATAKEREQGSTLAEQAMEYADQVNADKD